MPDRPDFRLLLLLIPNTDLLQPLLIQLPQNSPRNLPTLCNHLIHFLEIILLVPRPPSESVHDIITSFQGSLAESHQFRLGVSGRLGEDSEIDLEGSDTQVGDDDVGCDEGELPVWLEGQLGAWTSWMAESTDLGRGGEDLHQESGSGMDLVQTSHWQ